MKKFLIIFGISYFSIFIGSVFLASVNFGHIVDLSNILFMSFFIVAPAFTPILILNTILISLYLKGVDNERD